MNSPLEAQEEAEAYIEAHGHETGHIQTSRPGDGNVNVSFGITDGVRGPDDDPATWRRVLAHAIANRHGFSDLGEDDLTYQLLVWMEATGAAREVARTAGSQPTLEAVEDAILSHRGNPLSTDASGAASPDWRRVLAYLSGVHLDNADRLTSLTTAVQVEAATLGVEYRKAARSALSAHDQEPVRASAQRLADLCERLRETVNGVDDAALSISQGPQGAPQ